MNNLASLDFCPELRRLIETKKTLGRTGKQFDSLGAMSTLNNVLTIRSLMLEIKPLATLEVGLAFGGSALTFAATHRELKGSTNGRHYAMDPYQTRLWDDCALVALEQAGLRDYVDFKSNFSWLAIPQLISEGTRVDLAYIDGSHLFEDAFIDFFLVARALRPGGVILFDDSADPHVSKVLRFISSNLPAQFTELDLTPYRPQSERNLKYRLAKLIGKTQLRAFVMIDVPERVWHSPLSRF